jgi:hypothetical protein
LRLEPERLKAWVRLKVLDKRIKDVLELRAFSGNNGYPKEYPLQTSESARSDDDNSGSRALVGSTDGDVGYSLQGYQCHWMEDTLASHNDKDTIPSVIVSLAVVIAASIQVFIFVVSVIHDGVCSTLCLAVGNLRALG